MAFFRVSVDRFDSNFPTFREPSEVGWFSLDSKRQFFNDNRQIRYVKVPPLAPQYDLNVGFTNAVRKDILNNEKLDNMLRFINLNRHHVLESFPCPSDSEKPFLADFVCYRGLLTTILCSPYEFKEDWIICATKFRGIIYLCAFPTAERLRKEMHKSQRESLMSYWGYKFEQYMTAGGPDANVITEASVNENEEYCVIAKGRLNKHTFIFGAEVDGVDLMYSGQPTSIKRYCELKTMRRNQARPNSLNYNSQKMMKWWAQSFLIGIPKVICGFRDDNGLVTKVEVHETKTLPSKYKDMWSPSVMMNCCDKFLTFVKEHVTKDDPKVVYKFHYVAGQNGILFEELRSPKNYQILPDWYLSSWACNEKD